ncbi:MAG TPA: hypothetical protein VLT33_33910 [Labilithrix sp.]|nr:hypothetical protein [Labilithrix sp.]
MSRTLGDDFEDDAPGGSLDLEKGSPTGGGMGGGASHYDGGGRDFDDPFAEEGASGPLELDLPQGSATALRSAAPGPHTTQPPAGGRSAPPGGPAVPDLAFGPPASSRSSGMVPAAPPPVSSRPAPPAASSQRSLAPTSNDAGAHSHAPPSGPGYAAASSMHAPAPAPPSRPTAAAVIAKYPDPPSEVRRAPKYAIQVLLRQLELRSDLESLRRRRSPDVPLYEAALRVYDVKTFRLGMAINAAVLVVAMVIFFMPVILRFMRAD